MKNFFSILFCSIGLLLSSGVFAGISLRTEINGIDGDAKKNVEQRLAVNQADLGKNISNADIKNFYTHAPISIKKALEPYGFFKPRINSHLTWKNETAVMQFSIEPGPAIPVTNLNVKIFGPGSNDPEIAKALVDLPLKIGEPFETTRYEKTKTLLFQAVNNQGYIKAVLRKKEVIINLHNYTASVILHLDSCKRYYFGETQFTPSLFSEEFLQRFLTYKPGEPFSSEKLLKLQQAMSNSRFFQAVSIDPELNSTHDSQIPVKMTVTARKAKQYSIGAGYGTFTGPRITASAGRRITKTGHQLNAQIKLSQVLSGVAIKYSIPGKNPLTDQYILGVNSQIFRPRYGVSSSYTFSASYLKTLYEWQSTLGLNYLVERFQVYDDDTQLLRSKLLYPEFNLSRVITDDLIDPRNGRSINFTIRGATDNIGSSNTFVQSELRGKLIYSPFSFGTIVIRGDIGTTVVDDLQKLPLSMRFFAGGIGSIRGYRFNGIGPGRYLRVGSVEYQQRVWNNWKAAIFYDIGTASDHINDPVNRGQGLGIIYQSIVGPIKLYWSRAMTTPGKPHMLELNIGPEF